MVLDPSDYRLPAPGQGGWNPTNVRSFLPRVVGALVSVSVVAWVLLAARNAGVPLLDRLTRRVGVTSEGRTETEVF